jgi:hypothetical protein
VVDPGPSAGSSVPPFEQAVANKPNIKIKIKPLLVIILQPALKIDKSRILPLSRKWKVGARDVRLTGDEGV